jgi:hypothetical protein
MLQHGRVRRRKKARNPTRPREDLATRNREIAVPQRVKNVQKVRKPLLHKALGWIFTCLDGLVSFLTLTNWTSRTRSKLLIPGQPHKRASSLFVVILTNRREFLPPGSSERRSRSSAALRRDVPQLRKLNYRDGTQHTSLLTHLLTPF